MRLHPDAPLSSSAAAAKSLQSCLTLCDPIDGSPPGSPIPGILQARTLECEAIIWPLWAVLPPESNQASHYLVTVFAGHPCVGIWHVLQFTLRWAGQVQACKLRTGVPALGHPLSLEAVAGPQQVHPTRSALAVSVIPAKAQHCPAWPGGSVCPAQGGCPLRCRPHRPGDTQPWVLTWALPLIRAQGSVLWASASSHEVRMSP